MICYIVWRYLFKNHQLQMIMEDKKMKKNLNEYKCYEYKVNRHYYVLVIIKEDCAEFMLCKLDSNVRYWVCTEYLDDIDSVDECIKTIVKSCSQEWIRMWKARCDNDILSYDD